MTEKNLEQHVREMRAAARSLAEFSAPHVSNAIDIEILPLKVRYLVIDGYEVEVMCSLASYDDIEIESVHVQSAFGPFLPFSLVCKIGRAFLGSDHLSFVDIMKRDKKIYCWTLRLIEGRKVPAPKSHSSEASFESFNYRVLKVNAGQK